MLATLQPLRQSICQPQSCRAFSTSVVAREGTRPFTLPSAKLRALITLYHRSASFITPANLSSRIDRAFTGDSGIVGKSGARYATYEALQSRLQYNREGTNPPDLNYRFVPLNNFDSATWSGMVRGQRQALISAALWGVQVGGKPSLETVQETKAADEELGNLLDQTHRL